MLITAKDFSSWKITLLRNKEFIQESIILSMFFKRKNKIEIFDDFMLKMSYSDTYGTYLLKQS